MRVRVGQPLVAYANVRATPPATLRWFYEGGELRASAKVEIAFPAANSSTLKIHQPSGGRYVGFFLC